MASKLWFVLFLVEFYTSVNAATLHIANLSGTNADLGPITAPVGSTSLEWLPEWGEPTLNWGTNTANLGVNGRFEIILTPGGMGVTEHYTAEAAFAWGLAVALTQGLISTVAMAMLRKLSPGRAASPEL